MHIHNTSRDASRRFQKCWLTLGLLLMLGATAHGQDAFIDAVTSFTPGTNAGFGAASLPDIIQGPPRGGGALQGSLDVVSLGNDGVIVVRFDLPVIYDGPGPDFTVFENAFHAGSINDPVFTEFGIVAVSQDGVTFFELPAIAGTPDFDRSTDGAQDAAVVRAGRAKTATVSLTVSAAMVTTPDRSQPATCLLTVAAAADVAGNVDPTPSDNTAEIELSVLDVNDLQ